MNKKLKEYISLKFYTRTCAALLLGMTSVLPVGALAQHQLTASGKVTRVAYIDHSRLRKEFKEFAAAWQKLGKENTADKKSMEQALELLDKQYNYMWKNSFVSDDVVENGAFITGGGVLVLPNDQNGPTTAEFARLPIRTSDRGRWTHVKFEGKWHSIKGSVHTHPQAGITPDKWGMRVFSSEDRSLFRSRMPNYNHYVMSKVETFVYFPLRNTYQQIGTTSDVLSGKIKFYR